MTLALSDHAQLGVRLATGAVNIWDGPVRSSKTLSSCVALIRWLSTDAPKGELAMLGQSEDAIARNVVPVLRVLLGAASVGHKRGELQIMGRTVRIFGGATERDQDRIAGMTLAGAYVDEASRLAESMWNMLMTRLSVPGARLFATTNPAGPRHWLYRHWVAKAAVWVRHTGIETDPAGVCVRVTHGPTDNLGMDPAYWARMQATMVGAFYRRYILGEWVSAEGAIYPTVNVASHVEGDITGWFLGIDHGTTNPTAVELVAETRTDAYVVDELRLDSTVLGQLSDARQLEHFTAWAGRGHGRHAKRAWVDPAAASFRVAMRDAGWPAVEGNNDVLPGILLISSLMAMGRYHILESCEHTIDEAAGYSWDPKKAEQGEDAPMKVDDHHMDAIRYEAMGRRSLYRSWLRGSVAA